MIALLLFPILLAAAAAVVPIVPDTGRARHGVAGPGPNEPAGFRAVFDQPMAARPPREPKKDRHGFMYFHEQPNLVHRPGSGTLGGALRITFPEAFGERFLAGEAPATFLAGAGFPRNGGNLYCRVRWRPAPDWTNGRGGGQGVKFFFYRFGGNDHNHYFGFHDPSSTRRLEPMLGLQWRHTKSYPAKSHFSDFDLNDRRGTWRDIEYLVTANTPGREDGGVSIWVDGVRRLRRTDVEHFTAGQSPRIDHLWVDPTYGRNPPGVPGGVWMEIDHWYCSVK